MKPSQSLLVHGASGAVGLATVQLAKAHGMVIYGTAGTDAGLNLVKANGAHYAFNHRKADYANELLVSEDIPCKVRFHKSLFRALLEGKALMSSRKCCRMSIWAKTSSC